MPNTDTEQTRRRQRRLIADHALYMSLPCSLLPAFMIVGLWVPVDAQVLLTALAPVVFLSLVANAMRRRLGVPYWQYTLTLWPCTALIITLFTYCTLMLTGGYECMARVEARLLAAPVPQWLHALLAPCAADPRLAATAAGVALVALGWLFLSPISSLLIHLYYNMKNRTRTKVADPNQVN